MIVLAAIAISALGGLGFLAFIGWAAEKYSALMAESA